MTTYASGMEQAIAIADGFKSDAEAAAYWAQGAIKLPTEDLSYTGAAGQTQAARLYRGATGGASGGASGDTTGQVAPTLLYIHGGGWVGGSIDLNDRACRHLAHHSGRDVISVSYRLAPVDPFPAGLEDCRAALDHFSAGSAEPMVLAGASAGANLALALALDRPAQGLVLFYGVFSADLESQSQRTYAEGFGLTRARVGEILDLYDPTGMRQSDPRVCPLAAGDDQLRRLPPALLLAAEHDVLRDDSVAMAARLSALDRSHKLHVEPGVTHGFINRGRLVPAADNCLVRAAQFVRELDGA